MFVEFCRFDPDDESELSNNTNDDDDLRGKEMRFLKDRQCNNGENHTMQGDCRAKFPIYTSECSSVLQTSTERPGILQDRNLPRECNVLSDQEDAAKSRNKISKVNIFLTVCTAICDNSHVQRTRLLHVDDNAPL